MISRAPGGPSSVAVSSKPRYGPLFAVCGAQASCAVRYPDLEGSLVRVLDRAQAMPIAEVRVPGGTDAVRVEMGEAEVLDGLFNALYSDDTTRVLPFLIDQLARGNGEVAASPAWQNVNMADYSTEGLRRSIDWSCAKELPFYPPQQPVSDPLAARYAAVRSLPALCSAWPLPALGAVEDSRWSVPSRRC